MQRGFEREDLFTVVLEHFQTDSADYADILLPATTQLEHVDAHLAYGHLYMMANNAAIAPLGEAKPNTEIFRLIGRSAWVLPIHAVRGNRRTNWPRKPSTIKHARAIHFDWESLKRTGWQKLNMPDAPFAQRRLSDAVRQMRVLFRPSMLTDGLDPLPDLYCELRIGGVHAGRWR